MNSLCFSHGQGARVWDTNGREYVDFTCSYGPVILGYADARVSRAVARQLRRGVLFPAATPALRQLSDGVCRHHPGSDVCLFFKSGSEAVAAAVRLARTMTKRAGIIRCGFHGWHDTFIAPLLKWHEPGGASFPGEPVPGVAPRPANDVLAWDGADIATLRELLARHRDQIAAVIVDPVQLRAPHDSALRTCLEAAREAGALLILDEIKTGLRTSLGGVQGLHGIWADITVLSKALANGFPLAAVVCNETIAELASQTHLMGTYNAEACSLAAALATLDVLQRDGVHVQLDSQGRRLIDGFNALSARSGLTSYVEAMPYRWNCMPHVHFSGSLEVRRAKAKMFASALEARGFLWLPNHMNYICLAHSSQHIDMFLSACDEILRSWQIQDRIAD